MISRRRFFKVGGAAGVAVAHPLLASQATGKSDESSLPPSLARLKPSCSWVARHRGVEMRAAKAPR
jgi:hypothetical protein